MFAENTVDKKSEKYFKGGQWNRSRGNHINIGGNIHPLLWGGYKVYYAKIWG